MCSDISEVIVKVKMITKGNGAKNSWWNCQNR